MRNREIRNKCGIIDIRNFVKRRRRDVIEIKVA